ncbi:MAG: adenosylcobinamide-GDP ribazoletransferase [Thermodesulfobacteriota bacterium]
MLLEARIALAFLTILPLRLPDGLPAARLQRSAAFFPLAGWLIGVLLSAGAWLGKGLSGLPPQVAAMLLVALAAWFTRGLHLDGVADLLDGLGGGHDPARRLAIMKDSSIGAFGVVGLVLLLGLKAVCLAALLAAGEPRSWLWPLVAAPVAARWAMAALACGASYPRQAGTGHVFVGKVSGRELLLGGLFLLPLPLGGGVAVATMFAALLPAIWLRPKATAALGGVTGDVLGAACELGEAAGWLAAVIALS